MDNYRFTLIMSMVENDPSVIYREEVMVTFPFSRTGTIGELKRFIENRLASGNLEGTVYYILNNFERQVTPEYALGSELLPEDIYLSESIIDNHGFFLAECTVREQIQPMEEQEVEEEDQELIETGNILDYLTNQLTNSMRTINHLDTLNTIINRSNTISDMDTLIQRLSNIQPNLGNMGNPSGIFSQSTHFNIPITTSINPLSNFVDILTSLTNPPHRMEDVVVGLHRADLDVLRVNLHKNFENKEKCDTCSICIDKFKEEDICRELKCHHLFHKDCIDPWLESNILCPVCRTETGRGVPKI